MTASFSGPSIESIIERVHAAAVEGLRAAAEHIGDVSDQSVPTDTGDLRSTRQVAVDADSLEAGIGYGSGDRDVAAVLQHERLDYKHDDGHAKFLELAMNAEHERAAEIIAGKLREAIS